MGQFPAGGVGVSRNWGLFEPWLIKLSNWAVLMICCCCWLGENKSSLSDLNFEQKTVQIIWMNEVSDIMGWKRIEWKMWETCWEIKWFVQVELELIFNSFKQILWTPRPGLGKLPNLLLTDTVLWFICFCFKGTTL